MNSRYIIWAKEQTSAEREERFLSIYQTRWLKKTKTIYPRSKEIDTRGNGGQTTGAPARVILV